ncbi:MAG: ATP-binding cassette domain-containing protein, partial [Thermoleophilia bacterium]|nr:ATP-binding cassette domain-containing protein [Thermoleophilia bacterium]
MTLALETQNLRKSFGGVLVIDDLSISVAQGEALGIVGPNGAGKTTWFNLISGAVHADAGKVIFDGRDITRLRRHERCRAGIGRTFQIPKPFSGMTVFENVLVGATHGRDMRERASYAHCGEVLEKTGLDKKVNVLAGSLTLLDR